jgi:hypothetical protein
MYTPFIYPLIPTPIAFDTKSIRGKLFIEGNIEHNYIRFRFCYAEPKELAPLILTVETGGKKHVFYCIIRDYKNHEVKTAVFHPEFYVGRQFTVVDINPLAEFKNHT